MKHFKIILCLLITGGSLFLNPILTVAQSQTSPTLPTTGIKTTDELLNKFCNFLKEQSTFTVEIDITYDNVLQSGEKVQYSAYQQVWVNKPNQLRSDYVGDQRNTSFYYDGKTFTLFNPNLNLYGTKPAPSNLDEAVNNVQEKYGITIPMSNLFVSDPCNAIKSEIQTSLYLGANLVNREPTYHILLVGETRNIQLWISQQEPFVPLKAIITYKDLPEFPQYTAIFSNWNFKPEISDNTFTFSPSKDTFKIEFLPSDEGN
ncbi:DUF2092 domain-containing protein [Crocosphaera sp. XPORK-15E]|uniref:DUF2092 domain-containing protein n=1 Tax=Crocosphaera sp. XPORK-15E TaxID=3110247 RepID=UPI002B2138D4|nr:DUF2092 domain-containing protein [Crocosphaera sp. XPORK-15E]MEA5535791.1 DUF2092 domain-containing protein [Crocosphaera sp. XPORK-15E]